MSEETISFREVIHESEFVFIAKVILLQIIIIVLSILVAAISVNLIFTASTTVTLVTIILVAGMVLQLINAALVVYLVLQWERTYYVITPQEILIRRGIFGVDMRIYKTAQIDSVEISKSLFGKLFNYGTVSFQYAPLEARIELVDIPRPEYYAQILEKILIR